MKEPNPGSVALTHGRTGTAWQRFASDGMWHSVTGQTQTWEWLQQQPNLVIVHHI